jgi:hypothetical protein
VCELARRELYRIDSLILVGSMVGTMSQLGTVPKLREIRGLFTGIEYSTISQVSAYACEFTKGSFLRTTQSFSHHTNRIANLVLHRIHL